MPMAMACLRLFTLGPVLDPLCNLPRLNSPITFSILPCSMLTPIVFENVALVIVAMSRRYSNCRHSELRPGRLAGRPLGRPDLALAGPSGCRCRHSWAPSCPPAGSSPQPSMPVCVEQYGHQPCLPPRGSLLQSLATPGTGDQEASNDA